MLRTSFDSIPVTSTTFPSGCDLSSRNPSTTLLIASGRPKQEPVVTGTSAKMPDFKSSQSSPRHSSTRQHRSRISKSRSKLLLILNVWSAVISFVSTCVFATILPLWTANFNFKNGFIKGDWPDALPLGPLVVILSTNLYTILKPFLDQRFRSSDYLKARRKVTISNIKIAKLKLYLLLTTLFLLLAFLIIAGISGMYRFWRPAVVTSSANLAMSPASGANFLSSMTLHLHRDIAGANPTALTPPVADPPSTSEVTAFHSCSIANIFTRKCNPTLYIIGDLQIAAITLASTVWLLNVVLCVFAARRYQHQKRKLARCLRAKAKTKQEWIEHDLSRAEKGGWSSDIENNIVKLENARLEIQAQPIKDKLTQPTLAHTVSSVKAVNPEEIHPSERPKLHYYNPHILPSRS